MDKTGSITGDVEKEDGQVAHNVHYVKYVMGVDNRGRPSNSGLVPSKTTPEA